MARITSGDDLVAYSPDREILKLGARPLFLTHSRADERVALHHAERLARAAGENALNVTTWFVDDVGHIRQMFKHPAAYEQRLSGFFKEAIGSP